MSLLLMLLGFGLLVAVHELGHFLVARLMGMSVSVFSVGFGPVLFKKQWGEVEYRLCMIPLGGYVQIIGQLPDEETTQQQVDNLVAERGEECTRRLRDPKTWYYNKHGLAQFFTILAGPAFSLLLAIPLFWGALLVNGEMSLQEPITFEQVQQNSPAHLAGILPGDQLVAVNQKPVSSYNDFVIALTGADLSSPVPFTVQRGDSQVPLEVSFPDSRRPILGVALAGEVIEYSPTEAISAAVDRSIEMTVLQAQGMYMLFTGQASTSAVSGPVGIFSIGSEAAGAGMGAFLQFLALLTVALGLFNLLPIPVLDGGHLVFASYKIITGKNVSASVQMTLLLIGMALLLTLVVLASYQDVTNIGG